MRVVVTGGAGFLGSHVADVLSEAGHDVLVFDQQPTSRHSSVCGDLLDLDAVRSAFRGHDAVCHLGAIGDVYLAGQEPALAASVNVAGSAVVCDAAVAEGVGRLVVASTWEVYGPPEYQPMDEAHPCRPDHPYSITKLAGERMAISYHELRGLDVVALRLGTSFGTRMRPNSVFTTFIRRALDRTPITIHGSGEQGRQFTHARDIGSSFAAALQRGRPGHVYNIVAERMTSIRELAEKIVRVVPTELALGERRAGDVPSARVSARAALHDLDWSAQVDFDRALQELIEVERSARASAGRA